MVDNKKIKSFLIFSTLLLIIIGFNSATAASNPFTIDNIEQINSKKEDIVELNNDKIKNTAVFHSTKESVTYKVTIKNNEEKDYLIKEVKNNNTNKYITYNYTDISGETINKNGTKDLIVTATYENAVGDTSNREQKLNSLFTIIYEDTNSLSTIIANDINYTRSIIIISLVVLIGIISLIVMYFIQNKKQLPNKVFSLFLLGTLFIPLMAKASSLPYTISFTSKYLLNDKLLVTINNKEELVDYNTDINNISIPQKEGYRFTGWLNENNQVVETSTIQNNMILTPAYQVNTYSINYDLNGGKIEGEEVNNYTIEDIVVLPTVSKEGYKYIGWKNMDTNEVITVINKGTKGNLSLVAEFDYAVYKISYENITEEELVKSNNPSTYTLNQEIVLNKIDNRVDEDNDEIEIFNGWEESNEKIETINIGSMGNKVLKAIWTKADPKTYEIKYNLNGGVVENPTSFTKYEEIKINKPEKTGYEFIGWIENEEEPVLDYIIEKGTRIDKELTAFYKPITYTIKYDLNGGVVSSNPTEYTIEDSIELNIPTKEGYTFDKWLSKDGTLLSNIEVGNYNDKELTALYNPNKYSIVFDKNDIEALGYMDNQVVTYDEITKLNNNKFYKEDYKFIGWNTNSNLEGDVYLEGEEIINLISENEITLYAMWEKQLIGSFISGKELNAKMKILSGTTGANYNTTNNTITTIKRVYELPEEYNNDSYIVSTNNSDLPIYMWYSNNTINYYTELEIILLNENSSYLFNNLRGLKNIDISTLNTKKVTNMENMFSNCTNLKELNLSNFNTSNVTTMKNMFKDSSKLEYLNISSFDTSKVKTMNSMFWNLSSLKEIDVTNFNTSNVTDMYALFYSLKNIKSLDVSSFNTSNVKDMSSMFGNLFNVKVLDLSNFNTSKVTKMENMFNGSSSLESIDLSSFDTRNVTSMLRMFSSTKKIKVLDISSFDTSKVTNMSKMFDNMDSLKTIYVSDTFTIDQVKEGIRMFANDINIVGEDGTTYNPDKIGLEYARIGEREETRGYFSRKKEDTDE